MIKINTSRWGCFDSETHTFYKNKRLLSEEDSDNLTKSFKGQSIKTSFFDDFDLEAWTLNVYDEVNGFIMFDDCDKLIDYLIQSKTELIWAFNLKFDIRFLNYLFFNKSKKYKFVFGKDKKEVVKNEITVSFIVDSQAYYRFTYHGVGFKFIFADFHNITKSSISRLAKDLKLKEQKTTMNYWQVDKTNMTEADKIYMQNDLIIMHTAIKELNKMLLYLYPKTEKTFVDPDNFFSTIASTAIYCSLYDAFPDIESGKVRKKHFQKLAKGQNEYKHYKKIKELGAYQGGRVGYNPDKQGKLSYKVNVFDFNSLYPSQMINCRMPIGLPLEEKPEHEEGYYKLLIFSKLRMKVKENCIPIYPYNGECSSIVSIVKPLAIFSFEFEELKTFYDIEESKIIKTIYYKKGFKFFYNYVNKLYKIKESSEDKPSLRLFVKLLLNSAYGKLAQSPEVVEYGFKNGQVDTTVKKIKICEDNSYSIDFASIITALARCKIMRAIMEVNQGNPRKYHCYHDTDSVHSLLDYNNCHPTKLGYLKKELTADVEKVLGLKTYWQHGDFGDIFKTKGLNVGDVSNVLKGKSVEEIDKLFTFDSYFFCKSSRLHLKGVLIYRRYKNLINSNLIYEEAHE